MEALPYFILNVMIWNLLANIFAAIIHIHPLFPAECFHADGPIGLFPKNEYANQILFVIVFLCILNCAFALSFTFPYRYFVFVYSAHLVKTKMQWIFFGCICVHIVFCTMFCVIASFFFLSYDEYRLKKELPFRDGVFCYWSHGWRKYLTMLGLLGTFVFTLFIKVFFASLLWRHLNKMKTSLGKNTVELHRKFLHYLVLVTVVHLVFGGLPVVLCILCALFPYISYTEELTMFGIFVLVNHGTIYAVASIVTFKPYHIASRRVLRRLFAPHPAVHVIKVSSSMHP
uniref:G_PROTEIN_RECEP_F1_2 domain-containing protein n=1 Tax=Steinernema glaseri TaxID=37863 RepID=A0A1I8AAV8_9BILA